MRKCQNALHFDAISKTQTTNLLTPDLSRLRLTSQTMQLCVIHSHYTLKRQSDVRSLVARLKSLIKRVSLQTTH